MKYFRRNKICTFCNEELDDSAINYTCVCKGNGEKIHKECFLMIISSFGGECRYCSRTIIIPEGMREEFRGALQISTLPPIRIIYKNDWSNLSYIILAVFVITFTVFFLICVTMTLGNLST